MLSGIITRSNDLEFTTFEECGLDPTAISILLAWPLLSSTYILAITNKLKQISDKKELENAIKCVSGDIAQL